MKSKNSVYSFTVKLMISNFSLQPEENNHMACHEVFSEHSHRETSGIARTPNWARTPPRLSGVCDAIPRGTNSEQSGPRQPETIAHVPTQPTLDSLCCDTEAYVV